MKVLIVKRDKIGDLLLTTPLLAHLKAKLKRVELHVLANDYNSWVVADDPHVDRLWVYRRARHGGAMRLGAAVGQVRQFLALRRERFDVAIAAGGTDSPRAIRRAMAVHARRTIAYAATPRSYGRRLTDPLPPPEHGHEIERMLEMVAPLGLSAPAKSPLPTFRVPAEWVENALRDLAKLGIVAPNFIVLGLSARGAAKIPSSKQVLRWAALWHERWGCGTLLHATPGEADNALYPGNDALAKEIIAAAPGYLRALPDGLPAAIGAIHLARLSVLPDSGLMHFAAASPGGVLGLFAGGAELSSREQWAPRGPRARVLAAPRAIAELDDAAVLAAVEPLLAKRA